MLTEVIHIRKAPAGWGNDPRYVYIGRPTSRGNRSGHFGNPFKVQAGSREEACTAFRRWLRGEEHQEVEPLRRDWIIANLHKLMGKILVCFCKPEECHGDYYVELTSLFEKSQDVNARNGHSVVLTSEGCKVLSSPEDIAEAARNYVNDVVDVARKHHGDY